MLCAVWVVFVPKISGWAVFTSTYTVYLHARHIYFSVSWLPIVRAIFSSMLDDSKLSGTRNTAVERQQPENRSFCRLQE